MTSLVATPDDAGAEELARCRELERRRFTDAPTPADLYSAGTHGYTATEIDAITGALDADRRLSRPARLLLGRPRIYGEYLLRYAAANPAHRTTGRARDAIRTSAEHDAHAGSRRAPPDDQRC